MKKQEPTIRLSSQKCVVHPCAKAGFILKSDPRDFSAPLCGEHMVARLTEWEAEDKAEEAREKQRKQAEAEQKKKEKPNATA